MRNFSGLLVDANYAVDKGSKRGNFFCLSFFAEYAYRWNVCGERVPPLKKKREPSIDLIIDKRLRHNQISMYRNTWNQLSLLFHCPRAIYQNKLGIICATLNVIFSVMNIVFFFVGRSKFCWRFLLLQFLLTCFCLLSFCTNMRHFGFVPCF